MDTVTIDGSNWFRYPLATRYRIPRSVHLTPAQRALSEIEHGRHPLDGSPLLDGRTQHHTCGTCGNRTPGRKYTNDYVCDDDDLAYRPLRQWWPACRWWVAMQNNRGLEVKEDNDELLILEWTVGTTRLVKSRAEVHATMARRLRKPI